MYEGQSLSLKMLTDGIVELRFDRQGESVNKFDRSTVQELEFAVTRIRATADIRGVLVTSGKDVFIVGADIFEFKALFELAEPDIAAHIAHQNQAFTGFEDLPVPTVVAINGIALGGGLEMTLAADFRVASETAQVGLPEVNLGLFPGYGGTVRLPRIAGAAVALEWITTGRPVDARRAQAAGVVDVVVPPASLRASALDYLQRAINSTAWRQRRLQKQGPFAADLTAFAQTRQSLSRDAMHRPAASAAVDLLERAARLTRDDALALESQSFARIARTQAAASLVQIFINDQFIKKKSKAVAKLAPPVGQVAVIGAGIMGGGIAYVTASAGIPSFMKDIAQKALDLGEAEARRLLAKQVEAGKISSEKAEQTLGSIQRSLDYHGMESADVIIEAVVENLGVKKQVLSEIEARCRPGAVIASNTSSLSISEMARSLQHPQNFAGMHFFNPVPAMPLVEVVRGPQTSDSAAAKVVGLASRMGKTPVVVKDVPGFLVNRILIAYFLGYLLAIRDGVDFRALDQALERFGWPMGPGYLADVIGLDTLQHVIEIIAAGYPDRMNAGFPHAVRILAQQGRLGQKNGLGFYKYLPDARGRLQKVEDPAVAALLTQAGSPAIRECTEQELQERLMLPLVIEAVRCLDEGVAATAAEIDMALILGIGFPRYAGGPLQYADWMGLDELIQRCAAHESLGPLYRPSKQMLERAKDNRRYY